MDDDTRVANRGATDPVAEVEPGTPDTGPNRNNAVGAAFSGAARRGIITRIGYRPSTRVLAHGRVVAVWVRARQVGVPWWQVNP